MLKSLHRTALRLVSGAGLALAVAFAAAPIDVARADTVKVSFPKGSSGVTLSGSIKGDASRDFTLSVKAGQVMKVSLSGSSIVYFNVLPPGSSGEAIFTGSVEGNAFSGTLGASGTYVIQVYQMRATARRGETGSYKLKISVTGASGSGSSGSSGSSGGSKPSLAGIRGMNSIAAIDEMSARGFANVDSFSSGNTQYGIYYHRPSRLCVQLTMADGQVLDARDIVTSPKCR